jgi:hypothetical protein
MANGRHSFVAFYPSDWLGGTARMSSRILRSVYFDVCLYNWDTAKACPPLELAIMLGDVSDWKELIDQLIAMGKLIRNDDGSVENPKAMAEARKALSAWEAMSEGGKGRRKGHDKGDDKPPVKGVAKGAVNGATTEPEPEPEPEPEGETPNPFAGESWDAWIEMRKKLKKAPTDHAIKLAIAKLTKMQAAGHAPNDVLDQSTMNGWTGLFELKEKRNGHGGRPSGWLS